MGRIAAAIREREVRHIVAECGICGEEHLNTKKKPVRRWPDYIESIIEVSAAAHRDETGHDELDVNIEEQPTVETPIEATINVE